MTDLYGGGRAWKSEKVYPNSLVGRAVFSSFLFLRGHAGCFSDGCLCRHGTDGCTDMVYVGKGKEIFVTTVPESGGR